MTVSKLLDIWFEECVSTSLRHGTRCDYKNAIENHIKPALGKKQIKDISIDDLQQYIDEKQMKYAASTLKAHLVVLNGAFKYAVYPKKYLKTKGGKPRTIDIGDALVQILKDERKKQMEQKLYYGELYSRYYYDLVEEDGMRHIVITESQSPDSVDLEFICRKEDNSLFTNQTTKYCAKRIVRDLKFHFNFHMLRHTHATMLIENGANMKDV